MFAWNAELEAAIREDPDDDARWSVLEDWILERDDARAEHIRLMQAGEHDAALRVTWQIAKDLFEVTTKQFGELFGATAGCEWRAGYITRGYFEAPASRRMRLLRQFLDKRTTALMSELRITIDRPGELLELLELLAHAKCRETLRALNIAAYWSPASQSVGIDAGVLEPLRLDELRLYARAILITYAPPLARLRRLATCPGSIGDLKALFVHGGFPALRELDLDLRTLEVRGWQLENLDYALVAPNLQILRVQASDETFAGIRAIAPSTIDVQRG